MNGSEDLEEFSKPLICLMLSLLSLAICMLYHCYGYFYDILKFNIRILLFTIH